MLVISAAGSSPFGLQEVKNDGVKCVVVRG